MSKHGIFITPETQGHGDNKNLDLISLCLCDSVLNAPVEEVQCD
jgi:hypothetical protein